MRTLYRGGASTAPPTRSRPPLVTDGDTVAWVGSDEAAGTHADAVDDVVELDGALVTPAFTDAHVHVTETGLALGGLDLRRPRSVGEILDAVERGRARRRRPAGAGARLGRARSPRAGRRPARSWTGRRAAAVGLPRPGRLALRDRLRAPLAAGPGARDQAGWTEDGRVERDAHHAARAATRGGASPRPGRTPSGPRCAPRPPRASACVHEASAPHIAPEADLVALLALAGPDGDEPLPEVVAVPGRSWSASEAEARAVRAASASRSAPGRRPQRRRRGRLTHGLVPRALRRRPRHQRAHLPDRRADPRPRRRLHARPVCRPAST